MIQGRDSTAMSSDGRENDQEIRQIIETAERIARRMNATFVVDNQKLNDFPSRDESINSGMSTENFRDSNPSILSC